MKRPVIYDVTRLATRFSRPAPNGIDRVDLGYARHFLSAERQATGALLNGSASPRAISNGTAGRIVTSIADHWRETDTADVDPVFKDLASKLGLTSGGLIAGGQPNRPTNAQRARKSIYALAGSTQLFGTRGLFPGRSLIKTAPENAIYLNTSQFPLWLDWYFRWLDKRPDVKAMFFIHDLLPLDYPEFFPPAEEPRHRARMEVLSRRADAVIVASDATKDRLNRYFHDTQRSAPSIHVVPLPVDDAFKTRTSPLNTKASKPYFVVIGTIEPRKNHLLLLHIWRDLVEKLGEATPRLVIVGARGWEHENVSDLLERCDRLQGHVLEARGLSTPGLVEIISNSNAVLMPTLAEGFGLPVVEALACGVHVIASKIAVFETEQRLNLTLIDPLDGPGWREAILAHATGASIGSQAKALPEKRSVDSWMLHCEHIEKVIVRM
ncbi:MAG: glycosyltransferase family 1 protein [Pseudomonadota bacterium]